MREAASRCAPRIADLDPDVADGFEAALSALGAQLVEPPHPAATLDLGLELVDVVCSEMLVYHRRFDDRRGLYRPSIRGFLEHGERRAMTAEEYVAAQTRRAVLADVWLDWLGEHRIDAILEPTVPNIASPRGHGYDEPFTDFAEISLTHYWDWTGFPVVALPSRVGHRSGLPVSVSLIGSPGADWDLLAAGAAALVGVFAAVVPVSQVFFAGGPFSQPDAVEEFAGLGIAAVLVEASLHHGQRCRLCGAGVLGQEAAIWSVGDRTFVLVTRVAINGSSSAR
jgi:hypothetical protein